MFGLPTAQPKAKLDLVSDFFSCLAIYLSRRGFGCLTGTPSPRCPAGCPALAVTPLALSRGHGLMASFSAGAREHRSESPPSPEGGRRGANITPIKPDLRRQQSSWTSAAASSAAAAEELVASPSADRPEYCFRDDPRRPGRRARLCRWGCFCRFEYHLSGRTRRDLCRPQRAR